MSQEDLAFVANMSRNHLSDIECGRVNVSLDTMQRIAKGLSIPMYKLIPDYKLSE